MADTPKKLAMYIDADTNDIVKDHELKENENQQFDYCEMENIPIYLGNYTQAKDVEKMKHYKYFMRVWVLLVIPCIGCVLTADIHKVFCWLIIVLCLLVFLFAFCKTINDNGNTECLLNYLNDILGIPHVSQENGLYDIETKYYGITYILLSLYYPLNWILVYSLFGTIQLTEEEIEDEPQTVVAHMEAVGSVFLSIMMGIVIASTYYTVDPVFAKKITDEKNKLLNRYKNTAIKLLFEDDILEALQKNKRDEKPEKRKLEIVFVDIFISIIYRLCLSYAIPGGLLYTMFNHDTNVATGKCIMSIYMIIMDIIFLSIWYFFVQTLFFYHYYFMYDIMFQLSQSIESTKLNDIIAWWELRKCYLFIIGVNAAGFSAYVGAALIGTLFCATMGLMTISQRQYGWVLANGGTLLYGTVLLFASTELGVSYHNLQLSHVNTLNKEKLKFLKCEMMKLNETYKSEVATNIFDVLNEDIKQNDFPLKLLGVRMNANFMLFLRGLTISVIVAIIVEIGE